jgi:hypothetical protein
MTEPLSAAVGAISLIGKACGAYSRTTVLISTYKHFDKNLNTVLINIETAEIIFYVAIRVLLSEGLGEIRAKEMMSNLWSNHWKEEHLEQQLCSQLGILRARAIANSVRSSTRVLEEIEEKLSKKPFNISKETTLEILVSKVVS